VITQYILQEKLSVTHRNSFGFAHDKYLSPTGIKLKKFLRGLFPFVTRRKYVLAFLERNRLLSELHWMAIENNNMKDEIRAHRYGNRDKSTQK